MSMVSTDMHQLKLDEAAEGFIKLLPLFRLKLLRPLEHDTPGGLSSIQILALMAVNQLGISPVGEIAKSLCVSKTNMTQVIDKLETEGLIERVPGHSDRRVTNIRTTDAGSRFLEDYRSHVKRHISERLTSFDDETLESLISSLNTVFTALSACEPG